MKQQTIDKLKELQKLDDTEMAHIKADELITEFLKSVGYEDVAKEYKSVSKWYS